MFKEKIGRLLSVVAAAILALQFAQPMILVANAANLVSDFKQCANKDNAAGDCHWISSIVQASNSKYYEGMSVPQRTIFTGIPATAGDVHTLTFSHLATKGGKHAYDWLTSYNQAVTEASNIGYPFSDLDNQSCYPEIGPPNTLQSTCNTLRTGSNFALVNVPDDDFISHDGSTQAKIDSYESEYNDRTIKIYGDSSISGASTDSFLTISHTVSNGSDTGDSDIQYSLTWKSSSSSILIEMAGHLAVGSDGSGFTWGAGRGSSSISGAAYHFSLDKLDGKSLGSQDNQVSSSAVLPPRAHLTVIKNVVNDNGGTLVSSNFTMNVSGVNPDLSSFPGSSNGTLVTLDPGDYSVTENAVSGYMGSFSTDCSGTLVAGDNKICTVTNDDQAAQLTVTKHVVSNNGGNEVASDFTMNVAGTNVSTPSFAGDESGTTVTLTPGSYSVSENGPTGYTASNTIGCSGTIALGEHKFCTFTNDDQPAHITLIKNVINDNGGLATSNSFGLTVGGNAVNSGDKVDVNANLPVVLNEAGLPGYEFISIVGDGCPAVLGGTVTLSENQSITCTINNDDIQPKLTVTKVVVNDNGGTAAVSSFPLFVDGTGVISGVQNGFDVGSYVVSETNSTSYSATISGDCDELGNVNLALGQVKTCTITNNDIAPKLTVIKHVINDNGGELEADDFTITVAGTDVSPSSFSGSEIGTAIALDAGAFLVDEVGLAGYAKSFAGDCSGTLSLADDKTCTVTNDDIAPSLTLIKTVIIDNGGTAQASDWTLSANGPTPVSGAGTATSNSSFSAGTYILSESGSISGYQASNWSCVGGTPEANSVTLTLGEAAVCSITNDDIAPRLTVIKHVVNNNGGTKVAADFNMLVSNNSALLPNFPGDEDGITLVLTAGTYSATEDSDPGYASSFSADCTGSIAVGESKTCTITNDDVAATRTLGFWQTHTSFTNSVFATSSINGSMTVGASSHTRTITNSPNASQSILYGAYYSSIPYLSNGKTKRTNIDKARMQLLQQLVTTKLNCAAFGCSTDIQTLVAAADAAYAGTNTNLILSKANLLDAYNNSGDANAIPASLGTVGSATPSTSQSLADKVFWNAP